MAKAVEKRKMHLLGSCQCGKVNFSLDSETPVPFMFCFCSICRKTSGAAFGCNIMGLRKTLRVRGKRWLTSYHARMREPQTPVHISSVERWFCSFCGSHLYILDDRFPLGVWPYAAAIDTPLPSPRHPVSIMTESKPSWVPTYMTKHGPTFGRYPKHSIAEWHEQHGWKVSAKPSAEALMSPALRPTEEGEMFDLADIPDFSL